MTASVNSLSTERTYYQDSYLFSTEATIQDIGTDEKGEYVVFDRTIFHPQGGGQPDDTGYFEVKGVKHPVIKLDAPRNPNETPYVVKHYFESQQGGDPIEVDAVARQVIDQDNRKMYARYHSAGHLLSNAVEQLYPQLEGKRGNHFPGQAFVVFSGEIPPDSAELKKNVEILVNELVLQSLKTTNRWDENPRTVQFGDLTTYPCGGTHVQSTDEIGEITVKKIKKDKGELKITYSIEKR